MFGSTYKDIHTTLNKCHSTVIDDTCKRVASNWLCYL